MTCTAKGLYRWMAEVYDLANMENSSFVPANSGRSIIRFLPLYCPFFDEVFRTCVLSVVSIMSDSQFKSGNWRINVILVMKISGYRDSYSNPGPKDGERIRRWSDMERILPFWDQCTFEENRVSVYHIVLVCLPNVS